MIQKKIDRVLKEIPMITQVTCDWCGKNLAFENDCSFRGWTNVEMKFGYESKHDCEIWIGQCCDACFEKYLMAHMRKGTV